MVIQASPPSRVKFQPISPPFLTSDPPGVTTEQSNAVQRELISLMDRPWNEWYPKVCISYATGTRKDIDVPGAGPGMMQAAAITQALYNAGIACASGLCVPAGNDWKEFLPKIESRHSRCEVLIVLLSPAFYRSKPCLLEVHKATKAKRMVIIPLRCAEYPTKAKEQWPDIDEKNSTLVLNLDQVQDKLGPLNALPPRGCFFDSPSYLADLVDQIRRVTGALNVNSEAAAQFAHADAATQHTENVLATLRAASLELREGVTRLSKDGAEDLPEIENGETP